MPKNFAINRRNEFQTVIGASYMFCEFKKSLMETRLQLRKILSFRKSYFFSKFKLKNGTEVKINSVTVRNYHNWRIWFA